MFVICSDIRAVRAWLLCTVMDALTALERRLANGEWMWHWLHDNPEWGEFTLLFVSLHREGDSVVAGLWEVRDDGTGTEDPVMFRSADGSDGERGKPNHRLLFADVPSALADLAVHDVTAAGLHDHATLVARYSDAVRSRAQQKPAWPGSPGVTVVDDDR